MAQLIQIRSRIRAVETIEKVTHAMRLIAMSSHTKGNQYYNAARVYTGSLKNLALRLHHAVGSTQFEELLPFSHSGKNLIILIGSQKGLCGNFNSALFNFFDQRVKDGTLNIDQSTLVAVGAKAGDFLKKHQQSSEIAVPRFSLSTIDNACETLFRYIYQATPFANVLIITNQKISFFAHTPIIYNLRREIAIDPQLAHTQSADDLTWYEPVASTTRQIINRYIYAVIRLRLLESLIVEASARFVSMDSATRNARTILDESRLRYNKLRQTIITKELTELASNL